MSSFLQLSLQLSFQFTTLLIFRTLPVENGLQCRRIILQTRLLLVQITDPRIQAINIGADGCCFVLKFIVLDVHRDDRLFLPQEFA